MLSQAEKALRNEEWIAFLGWTPHPVMGEMDIAYLDGMGDSGFGAATVHTNVRAGYTGECPNAGNLSLENLKFSLTMENQIMDAILKGEDANEAAALDMAQGQPRHRRPPGLRVSPRSMAATPPPRSNAKAWYVTRIFRSGARHDKKCSAGPELDAGGTGHGFFNRFS
jgi:hypothetical protein